MTDDALPRRKFLLGAGLASTAIAAGISEQAQPQPAADAPAAAAPPAADSEPFVTLTATEAAFIVAAVDTLIPADALSPSGTDCGIASSSTASSPVPGAVAPKCIAPVRFIKGKPEQGYQLALTPREFFAAGIAAANAWTRKTYGKDFDRLAAADRVAALKAMEDGQGRVREFRRARILQSAARAHHGGLLLRSDLWRQSRQGRLAACSAFRACRPPMPTRSMTIATNVMSRSRNRSRTFRESEAAMATRLKEVDAVVIGMGLSGAIIARELTKAGLNVVALERGPDRNPAEEFTLTRLRDELKYVSAARADAGQFDRHHHLPQPARPACAADPALRRFPARRRCRRHRHPLGCAHWRFLPTDFRIRRPADGADTAPKPSRTP